MARNRSPQDAKKRAAPKKAARKRARSPKRAANPAADVSEASQSNSGGAAAPSPAEIRRDRFARLVAAGGSYTGAYLEVFSEIDEEGVPKMSIAVAASAGHRLAKNVEVRALIAKHVEQNEADDKAVLQELKEEAADLYFLAKMSGELAAANRALQNRAVLTGHWVEKRDVGGSVIFHVSDQPEPDDEGEEGGDPEEQWAARYAGATPSSASPS